MATTLPLLCERRYSVEEILSMKSKLQVNSIISKLKTHPDIGILRGPDEFLVDVTNRRKFARSSRRTEDFSGESEAQLNFSTKLTSSTRQDWHLRRRDSSLRSSEPLSAPAGIASQQSENFQRFYRAVVSPTHVRVTAGGRIVPNNRAIAPPKFDWNPDKCIFEPPRPSEFENSPVPELWIPPIVVASPLPNYNFVPQVAASANQGAMATQNPHIVDGRSLSSAPFSISSSNSLAQSAHATENIHLPNAADLIQLSDFQQTVKISPPSQFDQSRPFIYNGQIVYPIPAGFQPPINSVPVPITVLGDPTIHHQVPPNGNLLPPSFPMPMPIPFMPPGVAGHHPMMLTSGGTQLENGLPIHSYMQQFIPGMVSLSELTKSQIHGLRSQVKHIDNQLVNNKHQVDETFLQRQRVELTDFIEKMETMLHMQLGQEMSQSSMALLNNKYDENHSGPTDRPVSTENLRKADTNSGIGVRKPNLSRSPVFVAEEFKDRASISTPPIPLFVPTPQQSASKPQSNDTELVKAFVEAKLATRSEPAIKSRLTVAAAKAPPFQPRAHAVLDNRRTANSSSDFGQLVPYTGLTHSSLSRAQSMQASQLLEGNKATLLQRAHTFHAQNPGFEPASKPYLVGTLPNGTHIGENSDILYSRPLTNDEVRARHLYWGDAPRSALKGNGLPKFDGKDFYPPSPVKGAVKLATHFQTNSPPATVSLPNFETLFTDPQTPRRGHAKCSEQDIVATPSQGAAQSDIIGFQSPSPRPATYTFQNRLPENWSSSHYGKTEESNQGQTAHSVVSPTPAPDDFSTLFTSPSAHRSTQNVRVGNVQHIFTSQSKSLNDLGDSKDGGRDSVDSWGAPRDRGELTYEDLVDLTSIKTNSNDLHMSSATVEIRLPSNDKVHTPKRASGNAFTDKFGGGDSSTLFLQNMLRNTAAATMVAPAVSGPVSSATAQGFLPSHRGSAAASLAPTMFNPQTMMERDDENGTLKIDQIKINAEGHFEVSTAGVSPLIAANFLPENRPIDRDRPRRPVRASVETLGAEGYLRYLTQKTEDDKKIVEEGWNPNTTGTGPVMGSNW